MSEGVEEGVWLECPQPDSVHIKRAEMSSRNFIERSVLPVSAKRVLTKALVVEGLDGELGADFYWRFPELLSYGASVQSSSGDFVAGILGEAFCKRLTSPDPDGDYQSIFARAGPEGTGNLEKRNLESSVVEYNLQPPTAWCGLA